MLLQFHQKVREAHTLVSLHLNARTNIFLVSKVDERTSFAKALIFTIPQY